MTQEERDRLVALRRAKKKPISQREAAEVLGLSVRRVKRLFCKLKQRGDKAVIHGQRGVPSKRRIDEKVHRRRSGFSAAARNGDSAPR
jgi:biotin operon repressor